MEDKIQKAVQYIRESKGIMILTGAGISTESGIPDFRSPGTGIWEYMDPMEALSVDVLYNHPEKFYRQGFKILTSMKDAVPNTAHRILVKMEEAGIIDFLVTQNIDNLHQKAGSKKVYEVHGHVRSGSCLDCKKEMIMDRMVERVETGEMPPHCDSCGGIVRPNVVMFGDALPPCFDRVMEEIHKCDLLIVIGSSLEVGPVNLLAYRCKKLMIINLGATAYDYRADLIIRQKSGETLKKIYEALNLE